MKVVFASSICALLSPFVKAAVFDMHLDPVGYVRTDPILDDQCLSGHVHAFYGAKNLFPSTAYEDLISTDFLEVSGNIKENKSLYWHPAVYKELPGGIYELQETKLSVYYIWDAKDASVRAFEPGFAMIAGGDKLDDRASLNFECEGNGPPPSTKFPSGACQGEFFVEMKMPNCWNGMERDSMDSHVTYSVEGGNESFDVCPPGFSKIPQLWLFIEFPNGYTGGNHVFSDGSDVLHVDYFNGWVEAELRAALRGCDNDDFNPTGGSVCSLFNYKNVELNLGEDVSYAPPERFPTELITTEAITRISMLPGGSPRKPDGSCADGDQPLSNGNPGGTPAPTQNPTEAPTPAPTSKPEITAAPTSKPTQAPTPQITPSPTSKPTGKPTQAPTPTTPATPPTAECKEECWNTFDICDNDTDDQCGDEFLEDCQSDCEEDHQGSELRECKEEWCMEDQEHCFEQADKNCRRTRRKCARRCQKN